MIKIKRPQPRGFACSGCGKTITAKQIEKAGGFCPNCSKDYYK